MSAQVTGLCVGSVLTSPKCETLYMSTFSLVVSFPAICLRRWEVSCITYITTSRWLTSRVVLLLSLGSLQPSDLSSPLGILLLSLGAAGSEREEVTPTVQTPEITPFKQGTTLGLRRRSKARGEGEDDVNGEGKTPTPRKLKAKLILALKAEGAAGLHKQGEPFTEIIIARPYGFPVTQRIKAHVNVVSTDWKWKRKCRS
jgi:hypothetical protein